MNINKVTYAYPVNKNQRQNNANFKAKNYSVTKIASILGQSREEVLAMTEGKTKKQILFLKSLYHRYNATNFDLPTAQKENSQIVNELMAKIKSPTLTHISIVEKLNGSFEELSEILNKSENNPAKLKLANISIIAKNNDLFPKHKASIHEILDSKFAEEYGKNFDKYESYFESNKDNEKAIIELDELLEKKSFNKEKYDKLKNIRSLFKSTGILNNEKLNETILVENYSKEGNTLFDKILSHYNRKIFKIENSEASLIDIYKTTNKKNLEIRYELFKNNLISKVHNDITLEELNDLNKLFNMIDKNKNAKNFVKKYNNFENLVLTPNQYIRLLEEIPAKKLEMFSDNVNNILKQTSNEKDFEKRISLVKNNIENPHYETYNTKRNRYLDIQDGIYYEYSSKFENLILTVKNKAKQAIYNLFYKNSDTTVKLADVSTPKPAIKVETPVASVVKEVKPEIKVETPVIPVVKVETPVAPVVKEVKPDVKVETSVIPAGKEVAKTAEELKEKHIPVKLTQRQINKQKVAEEVRNIIHKKLSAKTLERQEKMYEENATKMKLNLLDEMFASVKETRAVDRLVGKNKSGSSNLDVITLYNKINGKNKKLINYLLKKRNVDDTRMFEIKDIIKILDKAEKHVKDAKLTPKEEKEYYSHLFDAKIEQYGKVKQRKTTKK